MKISVNIQAFCGRLPLMLRVPEACSLRFRFPLAFLLCGLAGLLWTTPATAAPTPPGLRLTVSPYLNDVGDAVTFTVSAKSWPAPATVVLTFVSPHHGFRGTMLWFGKCGCFRLGVVLARRVHPIEQGKATATITYDQTSLRLLTGFTIRGLAPNGRDYSPGGRVILTGWISDPAPVANEYQHYCAWVTTVDHFGVAGYPVRFVVHFPNRTSRWSAGKTGRTGLVCLHKAIGHPKVGKLIAVDIYAGSLHTRASFKRRA